MSKDAARHIYYHEPRVAMLSRYISSSIVGAGFSPVSLYASGEQGGLYDPSNLGTLFQETTGIAATTPAAVNGPVGTVLDLSGRGNHLVSTVDAARPTLRQSGALYYLEFDGTDDTLEVNDTAAWNFGNTDFAFWLAFRQNANGGNFKVAIAKTTSGVGSNFRCFLTAGYDLSLFYGSDAQQSSVSVLNATQGSDHVAMWGRDASNDRYALNASSDTQAWAALGTGSSAVKPRFFGDGNASYRIGGRFYASAVIDRFLTGAETAKLKTWLGARAGLSL